MSADYYSLKVTIEKEGENGTMTAAFTESEEIAFMQAVAMAGDHNLTHPDFTAADVESMAEKMRGMLRCIVCEESQPHLCFPWGRSIDYGGTG